MPRVHITFYHVLVFFVFVFVFIKCVLPQPPTPLMSPNEHNSHIWTGQASLQGPSCLSDLPGFPPGQKADQLAEQHRERRSTFCVLWEISEWSPLSFWYIILI